MGCEILCPCLNVKSSLYCIFVKKESEEIKILSTIMLPTRVNSKQLMSYGMGRG